MEIRATSHHFATTKRLCWVCGLWDRAWPGEVAFFAGDDFRGNDWVCDQCVKAGGEHIRRVLLESAEDHRRFAAHLEGAAHEDMSEDEEWYLRLMLEYRLACDDLRDLDWAREPCGRPLAGCAENHHRLAALLEATAHEDIRLPTPTEVEVLRLRAALEFAEDRDDVDCWGEGFDE